MLKIIAVSITTSYNFDAMLILSLELITSYIFFLIFFNQFEDHSNFYLLIVFLTLEIYPFHLFTFLKALAHMLHRYNDNRLFDFIDSEYRDIVINDKLSVSFIRISSL